VRMHCLISTIDKDQCCETLALKLPLYLHCLFVEDCRQQQLYIAFMMPCKTNDRKTNRKDEEIVERYIGLYIYKEPLPIL